jgi:hypothetical protein
LWALGKSGLRSDATDGGAGQNWPTPDAAVMNDGEHVATTLERRERLRLERINGNGFGLRLTTASLIWPNIREPAEQCVSGPQAQATPMDGEPTSPSIQDSPQRRLNPAFVEALMGVPHGWTDCESSATDSYQQWQRRFSER